ncbi:MAG: hypothetical protein JW791_03465 [Nanoarchaeota archaeon]|nr:hypothetical protein [Nanoarchaeota archaeon]
MVKVVKVVPKKKKPVKPEAEKSSDKRVFEGLDYIKSLPKKEDVNWATPKGAEKEDFESFKPESIKIIGKENASWAKPEGVKREDFGPLGVIKEGTKAKIKVPRSDDEDFPSWAEPKGFSDEDFGPVGLGFSELKEVEKPRKIFKQVKTGIKGLDEVLDGGIPQNNLVTVSGGLGSGKTILCLQFIYAGAKKYNEPGVFISLEEEPERLMKTAEGFGWNFQKLIDEKKIIMLKTPLYKFEVLKNIIRDSVYRIKAKRLVIDPGALFALFFERDIEVRKAIVELGNMLKKLNCTTIVTTEESGASSFNQGDFSSDGIIFTYHTKISNQFMRMVAVIKMRGTGHSEKLHPLRFTKDGIEVLSEEEVFQDIATSRY